MNITPLVPDNIHLVLEEAIKAHAQLLKYFYSQYSFNYIGDMTRENYDNLCEELYDIDSSDQADRIIRTAREAFGKYAYQREAILF